MSRLGARIKRRRSEEKIRTALSDPRIQAHIQEWIAPKPDPIPKPVPILDSAIDRVYLAALTIAIALGLSWAVRSLCNGGAS